MKLTNNLPTFFTSPASKYGAKLLIALSNVVIHHDLDSDLKEELISIRQINLISKVLVEAVLFSLTPYLPSNVTGPLQLISPVSAEEISDEQKWSRVNFALEKIEPVLAKKTVSGQHHLENTLIQYIFSCFSLLSHTKANTDRCRVERCRTITNREQYFRYLMLLKGLRGLPPDLAMLLHRQLMNELKLNGGFELLCRLLLKTTPDSTSNDWQKHDVIARIVAAKGHSVEFYSALINDIFSFLRACLLIQDQEMFIPTCVTCLKQLHSIVPEELRFEIEEKLTGWLKKIENPPETVAGFEILSNIELYEQLQITFSCFGGLPMVKLPSKILLPYLDPLFRVFCLAESIGHEQTKYSVAVVLTFTLNNRSNDELKIFIELAINIGRDNVNFNRVILKRSTQYQTPSLVVCSEDETLNIDGSKQVISLIKNSSNALLMYNVFVILLEMLQLNEIDTSSSGDLLDPDDNEQLGELLSQKFFQRYAIVEMLQELITFKPLHQQFTENPGKIIEFIEKLLSQQIENAATKHTESHLIVLLLTIFNELIEGLKNLELQSELRSKIRQLRDVSQDSEVRAQLALLLGGSGQHSVHIESDFKEALTLCASNEVHVKVNGSMQLIKLINRKDPETIANRFKVLAIAMTNLKHVESYAYLNTVRLLVALTNLLEAEVVDTLLSEFRNENLDTDYRLKLGEVIVKVTEALGPIAYKYKSELIDCFLRGCLNTRNEIRASSFSKLGTICKILTYQVHNFFHEALTVIQQTLLSDDYLPARRAAVMVLSQLLEGMTNIFDHQEQLLPVYRCLKGVLQTETDEVTRIHATLSLEGISRLVKNFLNPEVKIEQQIRITGVAEETQTMEIKYK